MQSKFLSPLFALAMAATAWPSLSFGVELVTEETITNQLKKTENFSLDNGIPVTYRRIEGSEILHIQVSLGYGLVDLNGDDKAIASILYPMMTQGAKDWPKEKIYRTLEKYSSAIGCDEGVEYSHCAMTTLNSYYKEVLPILAASIIEPQFNANDLKIVVGRRKAEIRMENQNPERYVNDVVNRAFYPTPHPFWISSDDTLKLLDKFTVADLNKHHQLLLDANNMRIVVVGSLDSAKLKADLNQAFGSIKKGARERPKITPPVFESSKAVAIEDKKIPTAYIRAKINTPGYGDKDETATKLLFKILDDELGDLIRTKLSLSYSVFATNLDYTTGIGVIHASTSKPKETLEAIEKVLQKIRTQKFSAKQMENFKVVYATEFFLTLEEHAALADALARYDNYGHDVAKFYRFPKELSGVTPEKIQELAQRFFKDFRIGIVYDKAALKDEWLNEFVGKKPAH